MSVEQHGRFVEANGYWTPAWQALLDEDAGFFATFVELAAVPHRSGALDPKVKELVCVAVNASATHLFEPGIRAHVRRALELGASKEEVLEVLQLTSTLGIHASTVGVPLLLEALGESDSDSQGSSDTDSDSQSRRGPVRLDDRRAALRADFEAKRGYWHGFWDGLLELDPDFFEAYVDFSAMQGEIFRTAGSSAARRGQRIERIFRDMSIGWGHFGTIVRDWTAREWTREHFGLVGEVLRPDRLHQTR